MLWKMLLEITDRERVAHQVGGSDDDYINFVAVAIFTHRAATK